MKTPLYLPCIPFLLLLAACSGPQKPTTPSLTPETAGQLLHYNRRASDYLTLIKKRDPSCQYNLVLPDQSNHPNEIDLDHIVQCNGQAAPREFDASVIFEYDKDAQRWTIRRFGS